jgi:hypothetical protein
MVDVNETPRRPLGAGFGTVLLTGAILAVGGGAVLSHMRFEHEREQRQRELEARAKLVPLPNHRLEHRDLEEARAELEAKLRALAERLEAEQSED